MKKSEPDRARDAENGEAAEPYLTLRAVAEAVGFHPVTLWRWRAPGHRIGSRNRYLLSEVRAWLDAGGPKK